MTSSNPPDSSSHRRYIRSSRLEDLPDCDLYSALLFAASDSMDAALSIEDRALAAERKTAAMREIELREAPRSRRTPPGGVSRTQAAPVSR